jgi:anti-sigma factor RsiW
MTPDAFEDLVLKYLDGLTSPEEDAVINRLLRERPDLADLFVKVSAHESMLSAPPEGIPAADAFEDLVLKYLDGATSEEENAALSRQVATRRDLADLFVRISAQESLLSDTPREALPLLSEEEVPEGILVAETPRRLRALKPRPAPRRWIPLAVAAGILGVAAIVGYVAWPSSPPPIRPVEVARPKPRPEPPKDDQLRRVEERLESIQAESRKAEEKIVDLATKPPPEPDRAAEERRLQEAELAQLELKRQEARRELERLRLEEEERRKKASETRETAAVPLPVLDRVEGQVFTRTGDLRAPARRGQSLPAGHSLETSSAKSHTVCLFADGTRVEVGGEAAVREVHEGDGKAGKRFTVAKGVVSIDATKQPAERPMTVKTPHGEIRLLGTAVRIVVEPARSTRLEVKEGKARLTRNDGKSVDVGSDHFAVAASGVELVARPIPVRIEEAFATLPAWASTSEAVWGGGPAAWTIEKGANNPFLQGVRTVPGSSCGVLVFQVPANSSLDLSVLMRCPRFAGDYWMETGFRLGSHTASDFDLNQGEWTIVKKFDSSTGQNGNNNAWTRYSAPVQTGSFTQVTVGFKLGSRAGPGPAVGWDSLRISH